MTLYKGAEPFKSWYVSIGRGRGTVKTCREDLITPAGSYKIYRVIQDATKLIYDPAWFKEEGEPQAGVYGSKLISFYNKWQIAIHGTNAPWTIGRRATHGCIRMRNKEIEDLVTYVRRGTRLVITEGDKERKFYKDTI
ncbi:MAG: L,D-transpeptidase [Synergistaceae bacterium]|nr:L,D-transpeptidase [Synergistaceae bacterium]